MSGVNEDIECIVENMHRTIVEQNNVFVLQNIVIRDIVCDILFKYDDHTTDGLEICIDIFNDNILDVNEDNISMFNMITTHTTKIHTPKEFCRVSLMSLLEMVQTLEFDSFIGRFIPRDMVRGRNKQLRRSVEKVFKGIGLSVKNKSQDCCVCYESTICMTSCKHVLCFMCASQIKASSSVNGDTGYDADSDGSGIYCPMCRSSLSFSGIGGGI